MHFNSCVQRDARKLKGIDHVKSKDPYNMKEIVMPLHEYINYPIARDLVHNGATFQVFVFLNHTACCTYLFPYVYIQYTLLFFLMVWLNRLQD